MEVVGWKVALVSALFVGLAGCGGGGDEGGGSPSVTSFVDGDFHYSDMTGKRFQNPDGTWGFDQCAESNRYFESANTMVFTSAKHSDDELKKIATLMEQELPKVVSAMGLTFEEFFAIKKRVGDSRIRNYAWTFSGFVKEVRTTDSEGFEVVERQKVPPDELSPYFADKMPADSDQWLDLNNFRARYEIQAFIVNTLVEEPDPQKVRDVLLEMYLKKSELEGYVELEYDPGYDYVEAFDEVTPAIHAKLQICATTTPNEASGAIHGVRISPDAKLEFYTHELTHVVQKQYGDVLPRWASEGQAVIVAGQRVAGSGTSDDIAEVLVFDDEWTYVGEGTDSYGQYARAYKILLETNSLNDVKRWFRESSHLIQVSEQEWLNTGNAFLGYRDAIKHKFGDIMVDENGQPMSYEQFKIKL